MTGGPAFICSGVQFLDGEGVIQIGTKICSPPPLCENDGEINCMANTSYAAAGVAGAADKIIAGQSLGGVSGNVSLPAAAKVLTGTSFGVIFDCSQFVVQLL